MSLVVAVFICVMFYPMMVQVDLGCLRDVGRRPGGLVLTLVITWRVAIANRARPTFCARASTS